MLMRTLLPPENKYGSYTNNNLNTKFKIFPESILKVYHSEASFEIALGKQSKSSFHIKKI